MVTQLSLPVMSAENAQRGGGIMREAVFWPGGRHRVVLRRRRLLAGGAVGRGRVFFIGANPSTAGAEEEDNTSTRWIGFASRWGFGEYTAGNLFAWCETHPREVMRAAGRGSDVVGRNDDARLDNDAVLVREAESADLIVVCWGDALPMGPRAPLPMRGRDKAVLSLLGGHELWCFGRNASGTPKHPLMLRNDVALERFVP